MSDNWIKDADKNRKQEHGDQIGGSNDGARRNQFWATNHVLIKEALSQLGETWKAQDPNQPGLLGIGGHPGNDYVVDSVALDFMVLLYLFDKTNLNLKRNVTFVTRATKLPSASLYVKFEVDRFIIQTSGDRPVYKQDILTVEQVKKTMAELWSNNRIPLANFS